MASRVLANLLVACSGAVFRAASQAWSKALQNAKASGVHAEHHVKKKTTSGGGFGTNGVSLDEAKKILPISTDDTKEQMLAKFDRAFAKNDDVSFYLQSKLFRAKETLGKEVFGMTEEEASADPRKKKRTKKKTKKRAAIKKAKGRRRRRRRRPTQTRRPSRRRRRRRSKKAITISNSFFPIDSRVKREQRNTDDKSGGVR